MTFAPVLWLTVLAASMMGIPVAVAQTLPILVDKNAPGSRPVVGIASNGVPVVNIAAPNHNGGTSVNNYTQYNVGQSGVVLNNSGQSSQTQLAGWVQGNMQLGNHSASVIVNQVTAPNPSQLLGMQEVAGNRATVIVANPAGITCSGCGVINADRFTLGTGRPVFGADGNLAGFDVRAGQIAIDGQGLSAPQAQVDLLARSISINAELWTQHLNAVAGANQVEYQSLNATAQAGSGPAPTFALDASALGSMYANGAIRLVGTEAGVGFNLGGVIDARGGDITVDGNGDVRVLAGARVQSQGGATLAGANIDNAGTVTTRAGIAATAQGQLTNNGTLAAGTDLLARADRIANTGTMGAGVDANANAAAAGTASIAADTALQSSGTIVAGANASLSAATLDLSNGAVVAHDTATLRASGDIVNRNARVEGTALQILAHGNVDNQGGTLVAGANGGTIQTASLLNQGGAITSGATLGVAASQIVDNAGGTIAGTGATSVSAASLVNRSGAIGSVEDKVLVAGTLDNAAGVIAGAGVHIESAHFDNRAGIVSGQQAVAVTGTMLDNTGGQIVSGGTAQLHADAITNTDGLLSANTRLDIEAGSLTGDGALQSSAGDISATLGSDFHNTRTIAAAGDLAVSIENAEGRAVGSIVNDGAMLAGGNADFHGLDVTNNGELYGGESNTVRTDRAVFNQGLIDGGAVRIQAGTTVTNIDRIFGDSVSIGAGGQILNDANPATGEGAVIASRLGDVNLGAPAIVNREHSLIYSSRDLHVGGALDASGTATGQASSLLNASATIDVMRDASFNVDSVNNRNDHFSTERIDSGTVHTRSYRLKGAYQDLRPEDVILYHVRNGDWAPGTDPAFLGSDDKKVLVLPSDRYPFSEFGPPFDWSRDTTGAPGVFGAIGGGGPVGPAYHPPTYISQDTQTPEVFVYEPGDAIWDKLGVARPTVAPPLPVPCGDATSACMAQYAADTAAYNAWRDANQPLYEQLNGKISAFNADFNSRQVREFYIVNQDTRTEDEIVRTTDPARILVGRNATFPGDVINDKSQILVGGDLNIDAGRLHNLDYDATSIRTVSGTQDWTFIKTHSMKGDERRYKTAPLDTTVTPVPHKLASAVSQHNLGTIGHDGNAPVLKELTLPDQPGSDDRLDDAVIRQVTPTLALPDNALFRTHPEPDARYLIETDPRFTDQRQWLSSDFMLTQLGQDPANVLKRLGDGYYEARLVADAVMLATGQRFVGDYTDNAQQYAALMKAGVTFAQQFNLTVGSELSAGQMAALTTDLVWLVEKTVTLPDGSTQRVLVPQVYLTARVGDLKGDGALISASNTSLRAQGDVVNTGTISSRSVTLIDAGNIRNHGGTLDGGTLTLNAREDIDNLAGKISGNAVLAYAGRDINLASTTASGGGNGGSSNTVLAGVSSVDADTATLVAGRDLNATAANLETTGDLALGAGRDVNLGTVTVARTEHYEHDARNKSDLSRSAELGTQVSAGGNATIVAGRDVNATAAYVNADGALGVSAGRDIAVDAGVASTSVRDEQYSQSNGFLSSSSTHSIDASAQTEALGSTFSGNTVDMAAGRDMTIAGSTVAATADVNLAAGNNLTVTTAETSSSGYSFKEEKKTGFGATGSGLSYGNRDQKDTVNDSGTQQAGSLVGSTDGNVHMQAGSTLAIQGSNLIAGRDVTGVGADVSIEAAQNRQHHDETHETKQSGFTLGVSGGAIGAAINAGNKAASASRSEDGRASALWGMEAGRDIADAAQGMGSPLQGAAVTLSWGTSQSKQTLTQDSTNHDGSRVQAGGTAAFVATGVDANGNRTAGNLNVVGSEIDAINVALAAQNDVNIVSATDSEESHSTNKSSSASVGVSYGAQGFGVSASGSKSKGNSDSVSATQTNSHVNGKESVTIVSGNDTNILGATVGGGKVVADIGGNLNIASRQDTGESHARQESKGGGFSISQGGGSASFSASKGKADGSYANVTEQSGIHAGEGGFDIHVKGNTDLKGAVIASDASPDKNSLTTGTLTWSDIANHSDYSATSKGISAGGAVGTPNGQSNSGPTSGSNTGGVNPMIPQRESGSQDGVAQAAVTGGSITITDQAGQTQDLATLNRNTSDTNSQVGSNPDLEKLLNKQADMMAAAQAAGEAVAKTVGQVANAKEREARAAAQQAHDAGNRELAAQYETEAKNWEEGGTYRAALHSAGGALVAGLGGGSAIAGAAGAAAASLSTPLADKIAEAVSGGANTGIGSLDEAIGNVAANIATGGIGAIVGGGSGAATAANTDRFNRQLRVTEKKLIQAAAGDDKDKMDRLTKAACYEVKCWSQYPEGSPLYNANFVSTPAAASLAPERAWIKDQQAQGFFTYTTMDSLSDQKSVFFGMTKDAVNGVPWERINDPKPGHSGMSDLVPTRGGWASDQHKAAVREGAADTAGFIGTQASRISATATAAASIPGPHVPLAEAIALGGTAVSLGSTAISQALKPNTGEMTVGTATALGAQFTTKIPVVGPALAPGVNETMEIIKNSTTAREFQDQINK